MSTGPQRRLRWTVTLVLLSSLVTGIGVLSYQRLTRPQPLEIVLPTATTAGVAKGTPQPTPVAAPGLVNVNAADSAELQTLNGIGPALAARIIAWRTENGPFLRVEDLLQVSGIGPKNLEDLRPHVTVE